MRYLTVVLIGLVSVPQLTQAAQLQAKDQASIVEFVQKAVVRALDYSQGDRQSLIDAQDDFSADAWREFMARMEEWVDSKGTPLSSSSFMPSGAAVITGDENGLLHLTVPGVLKQSQNKSTATYQVEVDVRVGGNPLKIAHLKPIVRLRAR
jgi:hypothetical protein